MIQKKDIYLYGLMLFVLVLAGGNAGVLFANLESREVAGIIASTVFVFAAAFNLRLRIRLGPEAISKIFSPILWAHFGFLVIALPLFVTRVSMRGGISDLTLLGLEMSDYHLLSTRVFGLAFASIFLEAGIHFYQNRA